VLRRYGHEHPETTTFHDAKVILEKHFTTH
jgi:hypothetical protein